MTPPAIRATVNAPANRERTRVSGYLLAAAACVATTLAATPLLGVLDPANIVMLFLLTVVLVAVRLGRGPAAFTAFASVALFDFFFVAPRFSFAVQDAQYVLTFAVMLTVALTIGELASRLRREVATASRREQQTLALYEMARDLSGAVAVEQVADIAHRFIARSLNASATVLVPDGTGELRTVAAAGTPAAIDTAIARAVFERGESMSFADRRNAFAPALCLPLKAPLRIRGVLVIESADRASVVPPAQHALLETVASLVAVVIERLHFADVARDALVDVESERLRNSLLSAISHDLRTPLTVLVGLADSLTRSRPALPAVQAEAAAAIRDQSLRMSSLVHNLLDMARLQAGKVRLRKEWQPLEEVIGSSLQGLDARLAKSIVTTRLAPDLPLLEFDAVLIERVLTNLLENAIKYAPGSAVVVEAHRQNGDVAITVADDGPGIPAGSEETIFKMFERGRQESHLTGVGLGLAISRAIVEAHGGRLWAGNRPQGGASFTFTLRAGTPPTIDQALLERIARGDP